MLDSRFNQNKYRRLSIPATAALVLAATPAFAGTASRATPGQATNLRQMFTLGKADGDLRLLYFANHNAFFNRGANRNTAAFGGMLGFTTAELDGFSLRLSAFAQQNFARTSKRKGYNRDLGQDISALGEAYIQWQRHDVQVRVGNQELYAPPFTATYDYRIIPQVYQGVKLRYGNAEHYLMAMRMFRFKSRISNSYDRATNYNTSFSPFPPNTTGHTDGFWAVGGADGVDAGPAHISGKAWFFNYKDYANMTYLEGTIGRASGSIRPFVSAQFIRETDTGRALLGKVDNRTYGLRLGIRHNSLTATLNYDRMPHRADTFLNGSLATPYATQESSGPLFAQPFLTSTQDLGSGNAYSVEVKGSPMKHTFGGVRYSYMDLTPTRGARSIGQSEYQIFGVYNFSGAFKGLSLVDLFAYQTQKTASVDYWENRLKLLYSF